MAAGRPSEQISTERNRAEVMSRLPGYGRRVVGERLGRLAVLPVREGNVAPGWAPQADTDGIAWLIPL